MHIGIFICVLLTSIGIITVILRYARVIGTKSTLCVMLTALVVVAALTVQFNIRATTASMLYPINIVEQNNKLYVEYNTRISIDSLYSIEISDDVEYLSLTVTREEWLGLYNEYYTLVIPKGVISDVQTD